jgi:arginase
MTRPIAVLGAPSNIGIKPYDDGAPRGLDLAPAALRECGLVSRLAARDLGDVIPPPYADMTRPIGRPRNESGVMQYSHALAERVAPSLADGAFTVVMGGDCSIVLGCLFGARQVHEGPIGLAYIDAHSDFATVAESATGSPAAMCAAMAIGRGESPLARLRADGPLVRARDLVMIGRRDDAYGDVYGIAALRASGCLDMPHTLVRERGIADTAHAALERFHDADTERFWIHVDADVLDPRVMPAVDSPEPDGLELDELVELLSSLVAAPGALGVEVTIYDPRLDPERAGARALTELLDRSCRPSSRSAHVRQR